MALMLSACVAADEMPIEERAEAVRAGVTAARTQEDCEELYARLMTEGFWSDGHAPPMELSKPWQQCMVWIDITKGMRR